MSQDKKKEKIMYSIKGDLGEIVIKQSTYDSHIMDERRPQAERDHLEKCLPVVLKILEKPRFTYPNYGDPQNPRKRYIDLAHVPEVSEHLVAIVVTIEDDRTPKEVVTWTIKRDLRQEKTGGIVYYDSNCDQE